MNFFNKFNRLKVKYKDSPSIKISFLLGVVSILLIFIGSSYAFIFKSAYTSSINKITAGNLVMTLENTTPVISIGNAVPTPDDVAISSSDYYGFTLKNNGSINAKYKISLINSCVVGNTYTVGSDSVVAGVCVPTKYIKAGISKDGEDYKVLSPDSSGNIILDSSVLGKLRNSSYKLKLWLDYDTPNEYNVKDKNIIISAKLQLYSEQTTENPVTLDKSGANAPEITNNMIPVYYDSTSAVWRKADINNLDKNNKWYDYDNKMWANAVTIDEVLKRESISNDKSVSLSNGSVPVKTYTSFTSGGYNINNAKSYTKITVNINTAGTFGFKATVSSEASFDKLTVTVSKNGGTATTVASAISGDGTSKTYSNTASVGDVYVITAQYTKDSSGHKYNDNGVLDTFTYPDSTEVTYTDSSTAGGTSGQDWTASGETSSTKSGVKVGNGIAYNVSTKKYYLNEISTTTVSGSLAGKYICPTVTDTTCATPYKILEASSTITKVDEYKMNLMARSDLVNAKLGTEIPMSDINAMWVWIPRYTYTYLYTRTPQEIKIKFESGTNSSGTIRCVDAVTGGSTTTSQTCADADGNLKAGTSTYTHPAFTFGDDELEGLWVGKFESSATEIPTNTSTAESIVVIKPNVNALTYKALSYMFRDARQMEKASNVYGFPQSSSTTFNWNGNLTGDTNKIDTHIMRNAEWGAVAYLSHSKYGRCTDGTCEEITTNNCSEKITGIGADEVSAGQSSTTCTTDKNKYNGESGLKASTTGNVYGVYDIAGGSYEYTMGNMVNSSNEFYTSSAGNWSTSTHPLEKYYDKYTYNTNMTAYARGRLEDAIKEMMPSVVSGNTWYSDYARFPYSSDPWFRRGGGYYSGVSAGAFGFSYSNGNANSDNSFRVCLDILN